MPEELVARQQCGTNYQQCNPSGVKSDVTPEVGSGLSSLYVDVLDSISGVKRKRDLEQTSDLLEVRATPKPLCCNDGTLCLLLQDLAIPFCYDNYTTNFFLPDGSTGNVVSGSYNSADGSQANLLSGNYTFSNGTSGNIYASDEGAMPNTATLTLPTPYTSAGVGSAIPATALGAGATYTTIIPGTTISPTTVPGETESALVNSGTTIPATTLLPTTVQGTTVAPITTTITKTGASVASASASTTKKSTANSSSLMYSTFTGVIFLVISLVATFGL
ncbi:MAG: hypothetical protein M1827_005637 [Pycnora praestabilis]|nr:MAG: hypothetical protein M1827_005637 [Pycnora praestabilis]